MKCPICQFKNLDGIKFCGECSYDLRQIKESISAVYSQPQSYTPKHLADKILTNRSAIEGERKMVTVLFADVANYTSMSEKLDPESVHQIMDGCFKILLDQIHSHEGTINQFTGDGVMALFGAPIAYEDHAQKACYASLSIQMRLQEYTKLLNDKFGVDFAMRIGINSGPVVVGSIGDDLRMDYTAIGDTTNLAARMESLAQPGSILVSKNTYQKVSPYFDFEPLGKYEFKGKRDQQEVYRLRRQKDRSHIGFTRQIFSEMVGRDVESNKLELQVLKAVNGEGSVVNVIGEPGIGKSRLIAELKQSNVMKKIALREGRAISIGKGLSFYPIIDIYKNWAKIKEGDSDANAIKKLEYSIRSVAHKELNEILPFIATLMGIKLTGRYAERVKGIEGEALEKLILKSVKDLLIKSSELIPVAIVIEDLHWADLSTIEFLESLFRLAETHRILFINVFRPRYTETGVRIVQTVKEKFPNHYMEIELQPLNEQLSEILVNNMLNISGLSHGVRNRIVKRAGGNPFFIEEVVRSFIDAGVILKKNGGFKVTPKLDSVVIPQTINDVLIARIDRLEEKTKDLVKTASVIGRSFFHKILIEVLKAFEDIDNRLEYLKEIQLIRDRIRMEELEYLFKHALTQEAVYESLLVQKRKEIHQIVAESIERVFKGKIHEFYGMLAYHYSRAENLYKAEEYMVKAGEEALRSSASAEALEYYKEALKLYLRKHGDNTDPEKLSNFEKNIAVALYNKGRWAEAVKYIDIVLKRWGAPLPKNNFAGIAKLIRDLLIIFKVNYLWSIKSKRVPSDRDSEILRLFYRASLSLVYFDNTRLFLVSMATSSYTTKFSLSKIPKVSMYWAGSSTCISATGFLFWFSNRLLYYANKVINPEDPGDLLSYACLSTVSLTCQGNWGKIKDIDKNLLNHSLSMGDFWHVSNYLWFHGLVRGEQGDFAHMTMVIDKLYEIGETYDRHSDIILADGLRADYLVKTRKAHEAVLESEKWISHSRDYGTQLNQIIFMGYRVEAQQMTGDFKGAVDTISKVSEMCEKQMLLIMPLYLAPFLSAHFFVLLEQLWQATVSDNTFDQRILRKQTYKAGKAAVRNSHKYAPFRAKILRLMGVYYWLTDKQAKALKWWDKAIKEGERLGAQPDLARTYFEVGKRFLERQSKYKELNGTDAKGFLDKARVMFQEMGMQWDLDEMDKIASDG